MASITSTPLCCNSIESIWYIKTWGESYAQYADVCNYAFVIYTYIDHHLDMLTSGATMSSYWSDDCVDDDMNSSNKNEKRPRTVLSSSQRRVLKTAFDLDPKPSKKVSVLAGKAYDDNHC